MTDRTQDVGHHQIQNAVEVRWVSRQIFVQFRFEGCAGRDVHCRLVVQTRPMCHQYVDNTITD